MTDIDIHAFLLTVSTRGDVSADCTSKLLAWVKKSTQHAYVVAETGESGKRHLHAALVFKHPQKKVQLRNNIWARYVQPFHPDSKGSIAVKLQCMPGHRWYDEYLRKESGVEVLHDTYDREAIDQYLPNESEQAVLIENANPNRSSVNAWWDLHVAGWKESPFTDDARGAIYYLKDCMHKNIIHVMKDDRILTDTAYSLWERRHNILAPSAHQELLLQRKEMAYTFSCRGTESAAPPTI